MSKLRIQPSLFQAVTVGAVIVTLATLYIGLFHTERVLPPIGYTRARVMLFGVIAGSGFLSVAGILLDRWYLLAGGIFGLLITSFGSTIFVYLVPLILVLTAVFFISHDASRRSTGSVRNVD